MIIIIANSLAYYDGTRRYDLGGLAPEQIYPRILEKSLGIEVVSYPEPWRTIKSARSLVRRLAPVKASVFILNVGMAECVPKAFPFPVRMLVDRVPWRPLRRRLNRFETDLLHVSNNRKGWMSPRQFRQYLKETVDVARAKFSPRQIMVVNIFHVPKSLEAKKPGTVRNAALLNLEMEKFCSETGLTLLDAESIFDNSYFLPDLVHLNARGHVKMASVLQEAIEADKEIEIGRAR